VRKKTLSIALLITVLCFTTSCSKQQNEVDIYSFKGESDAVMINNGLITTTDDLEKFIGGDLTFKVEQPSNIKNYVTKFFFYREGVATTVLSISGNVEGTTKGLRISQDMGSISSKDLFYDNDLEQVKKSLNFLLSGTLINGEKFEYSVVLDVEKVY